MSEETVNSSSKPLINKENSLHPKRTPNMSKLPVSARKLTSSNGSTKSYNGSDKKQRSGSKQPLSVVNKQWSM